MYAQPINVEVWCRNYINTYIEKDLRSVVQISDPVTFQRFLKLCAARIGNLLNYASIARDADISPNTAKAWISILEASYIIKLLPPYHKNFNKRVIKSPKLYFYDTALVCSLLGIKTAQELSLHPLRGPLFESLVIGEMFKYSYNNNQAPNLYFWRDVQGHEVDAIVEKTYNSIVPVEAKASMTISKNLFKDVTKWKELIKQPELAAYVVYGGDESLSRKENLLYSWKFIGSMLQKIYS